MCYSMKNPVAIIKYTDNSCTPSNQFDCQSLATLFTIRTETINETNSNELNTMLIGVSSKLKNINIGATNNIICKLDPIAISTATSILFLIAITTAVECSAAFPIIGITIMPTKNSLNPNVSLNEPTPLIKNSLSIAINIVAITKINIDFLSDHLTCPSSSGSDEYISLCV